jgi:ADP-sugar diphosphatase
MASFFLDKSDGFGKPVKVTLPAHVNIEEDQLLSFAAFRSWISTLKENLALQETTADHPFRDDPYRLLSVEIQSVDFFGPTKIGFLKLKATLENKAGSTLPDIAFLRGGSIAVLMILRAKNYPDERYVVLTEQPRVPIGSLRFLEIPAGMLDGETGFSGKAAHHSKGRPDQHDGACVTGVRSSRYIIEGRHVS